jgi:hypothetical protein
MYALGGCWVAPRHPTSMIDTQHKHRHSMLPVTLNRIFQMKIRHAQTYLLIPMENAQYINMPTKIEFLTASPHTNFCSYWQIEIPSSKFLVPGGSINSFARFFECIMFPFFLSLWKMLIYRAVWLQSQEIDSLYSRKYTHFRALTFFPLETTLNPVYSSWLIYTNTENANNSVCRYLHSCRVWLHPFHFSD